MKGPLSADRLFFISSLAFVVSFVLYTVLNYLWPIPADIYAAASDPTADTLGMVSWVLSIAGVVTFVLGFLTRSK
ncbi:MAG TPA: hypothetical protein VJH91_03080 [Candidatus Paceibacterota bacterium]